ncbi:hypothetical protein [Streptomyces sp. M41(2017)]|uniref:hypothetical protein n=1 Tax=Streptomyces sp. M41(2017) TaxID=1955065 RepID=UPI00118057AF|nr:hypothetical protein [Streptomyces sp. M41(2017)]
MIWESLARHSWRRPASAAARPDYARIARLERELGLADESPERPIRPGRTICLTKDCRGDTVEVHSWQGPVATRIHRCEAP